MRPLQDRKKIDKKVKTIIIILSIVIVVFISKFIFPPIGNFTRVIFSPVFSIKNSITNSSENLFAFLQSKSSLERENEELKELNKEYLTRVERLNLLLKENEELKQALSRFGGRKMILGTILAKPGQSIYDTLILDIGHTNGISIGKKVFAYDGILIGTVSEVSNNTSLVKLFSSPGEKNQARIEGLNIDVEITGRGGGNFNMEVPRDLLVLPGANVFVPEKDASIVAKVSSKISKDTDSSQSFLLVAPININQLNFAYVEQ